jgi:hypothetical protein
MAIITEVEVNGKSYSLHRIGALQATKIAKSLAKIIIPAIGGDEGSGGVAMAIISAIDKENVPELIKELTSGKVAYYGGLQIDFDKHYSEFQEDLLPMLGESLKENILGFFPANAIESLVNSVAGAYQV